MMKVSLFIILPILLSSCSTMQPRVPASEGFFKIMPGTPEDKVKNSVVKIEVPMKVNFHATEYEKPTIDKNGTVITSSPFGRLIPTAERCKKKSYRSYNYAKEACEILDKGGSLDKPIPVKFAATGFFSNKFGNILTAKHLVSDCETYYEGKVPFRCPNLKITFKNNKGETIVEQGATIAYWSKGEPGKEGDYAILKINESPNSWLKTCQYPLRPGTEVFAIGYPVTSDRVNTEGKGYKNADGTIRISKGQIISPNWNKIRKVEGDDDVKTLRKKYIFSNVDAVGGNSGGPLVTETGCVIGNMTRALIQGGPTSLRNLNTEYYINKENPVWTMKNSVICEELYDSGLTYLIDGCSSDEKNETDHSSEY